MAGHAAGLVFDLVARGNAPAEFIKLAGAADKAATATGRAAAGLQTASARMATVGATLTKRFTLPLLAIGAVGVDQAAKWQKSMTLIQTAGGETAAKTAVLSSGLKKLAVETGTSLDQLGEGIYTIAKAGAQKWSAVDQLKVMKAAAQGAKAEQVDLGTATDALSTVMLDYHLSASKAVTAENQLIRASGLAKTNFRDFAASMSNVVPIAAALGIKFSEVAGGIATMTQHGVSPQQATENMRNLLFNLAGQNNVASQAMQQLGINTVDLAKNLGRRGLTGTLAIVDAALKAHTRNGMVVIDVHKAAALATKSLNTMLGDMSGPLKAQAQGLATGRVSITDYTKFAKSLGGQAGASALQFKALYLNALGFSNQLRNGKGTVTTSTAQYAKLLGGMTGASVAMQIAGKYAKDNARNVAEVGKAAKEAGTDVVGWGKTSETAAFKFAQLKSSLQVLAVNIGTALLPAMSKLVGWLTKGVHWFEGLSGSTKRFIGYTALVVAALGPVAAIVGRVTKLISIMWATGVGVSRFIAGIRMAEISLAGMESKSYLAGLKIRRAFAGMSTGARVASSAIAGAMIGTVIGAMTQTSSTAVKVGGVIASAALGAATGWAVGGPLGAAIGGISGLLSSAASAFGLFGGSAKAQIKPTDDFTQAILRDNDALGVNTRALVENKLQHDGAYDAGLKLGIGQKLLTDALMGNSAAMGQVNLLIEKGALAGGKLTDAAAKLSGELPNVTDTLNVNKRAADNLAAANGKVAKKTHDATNAVHALGRSKANPKIGADTRSVHAQIRATQKQIDLIRQNKIPKVRANTTEASAFIKILQAQIDRLRDKLVTIHYRQVIERSYKSGIHIDTSDVGYGAPYKTSGAAAAAARQAAGLPPVSAAARVAAGLGPQVSAGDQVAAAAAADAAKQAAAQAAADAKAAAQSRADAFKSAYDTKLSNARSRLATAQGNYDNAKSTVRSAFTGTFDVTTAGQNQYNEPVGFRAMKRLLDKAVKDATRFRNALRRLGREGLNKGLIQQLADAGPAALPQALALLSATPKQLRAFNREYGTLGKLGGSAGTQVADQMYGAGVKSAQGLVDGLLSKKSAVNHAVKTLADGMIRTLRKELDMHSPSRKFFAAGADSGEGAALGMESKYGRLENASAGMGRKMMSGVGSNGGGTDLRVGGQAVHIENLNLHYPAPDTLDRGLATAIRNATAGLGR